MVILEEIIILTFIFLCERKVGEIWRKNLKYNNLMWKPDLKKNKAKYIQSKHSCACQEINQSTVNYSDSLILR